MEFFQTSNNIPVHISDTQKGDITILLLHGYLETLNVWEDFITTLSSSSPCNYRFISIDLPGHGLTGTNKVSNTMEFCSEVVKGVLDKCGVTSCHIVGHSMGGYIGLQCMKSYPDVFKSIVLLNSNPYSDSNSVAQERDKEISFILSGKLLTLAALIIPNMFHKDNLRRMDDYIQMILSDCETHDPEGIAASVRGLMTREDMSSFLLSVKDKALFIQGNQDHYFPLTTLEQMHQQFKEIDMVFIPETGHDSFLENPELVSKAIISFLSKC